MAGGSRGSAGGQLRAAALLEALRQSVLAALTAGLAVGLAVGVLSALLPSGFLGEAEPGQRVTLVATLLSATVAVVGVMLSILVLAQELASQQYSPRAIRTALRDGRTRLAFAGLFACTGQMVGALAVVPGQQGSSLAVLLAVICAVAALALVAVLVQRITTGFRSEELVRRIGADTLDSVRRIAARADRADHGGRAAADGGGRAAADGGGRAAADGGRRAGAGGGRDGAGGDVPEVGADAVVVHAPAAGYLQDVALAELAAALHHLGVVVRLEVGVGDFVAADAGLGWAWSRTARASASGASASGASGDGGTGAGASGDGASGVLASGVVEAVEAAIGTHVLIGSAPSTRREVSSGVQQLVDIALRALSPAINDPRTAVQAIDRLTVVLQHLAGRHQEWLVGVAAGEVVVCVPRPLVWDLADGAVDSVRRVAGAYPEVLEALVTLVRGIAVVRPGDAGRALAHLDPIRGEAVRAGLLDVDVAQVEQVVAEARRALSSGAVDHPVPTRHDLPDDASEDPARATGDGRPRSPRAAGHTASR